MNLYSFLKLSVVFKSNVTINSGGCSFVFLMWFTASLYSKVIGLFWGSKWGEMHPYLKATTGLDTIKTMKFVGKGTCTIQHSIIFLHNFKKYLLTLKKINKRRYAFWNHAMSLIPLLLKLCFYFILFFSSQHWDCFWSFL